MISLQQADELLASTYKGKTCGFTYPGYNTVTGKVDEICIDPAKLPEQEVVIQMNSRRYTVSLESLRECLIIYGGKNGNT